MDVITHNGVSYKKATAVAKEFGYTTDYIGQLCRAKKIDARLVGRAWYVNVADLERMVEELPAFQLGVLSLQHRDRTNSLSRHQNQSRLRLCACA